MARSVKRPRAEPQTLHELGVRGRYVLDFGQGVDEYVPLMRIGKLVPFCQIVACATNMACSRSIPSSRHKTLNLQPTAMTNPKMQEASKWTFRPVPGQALRHS